MNDACRAVTGTGGLTIEMVPCAVLAAASSSGVAVGT